jgi:hypothetical protein
VIILGIFILLFLLTISIKSNSSKLLSKFNADLIDLINWYWLTVDNITDCVKSLVSLTYLSYTHLAKLYVDQLNIY